MIIYFAGITERVFIEYANRFPNKELNLLFSFARRNGDLDQIMTNYGNRKGSVVLDSGTWTINNGTKIRKSPISLEGYIAYLKHFGSAFDFYFNYDEDFSDSGFERNHANLRHMQDRGLNPAPVIHDVDGEELSFYLEEGHSFIGLGSPQITSVKQLQPIVNTAASSNCNLHMLGNTSYQFITHNGLYSCDSSTWAQTAGFGSIFFWNEEKKTKSKTDKLYFQERLTVNNRAGILINRYDHRDAVEQFLREVFNLSFRDMIGLNGVLYRQLVNIHYFSTLQDRINGETTN